MFLLTKIRLFSFSLSREIANSMSLMALGEMFKKWLALWRIGVVFCEVKPKHAAVLIPANVYLDASEDVPDVGEGPERDVRHLEPALVVDVAVPVHLVHLVVHQRLRDQTVHPRHVRGGELVRVELPGAAEDDQLPVLPLGEREEVARVDDLREVGVFAVQVPEPVRVELADDQVAFQHLAGLRDAELLRAEETQQEWGV